MHDLHLPVFSNTQIFDFLVQIGYTLIYYGKMHGQLIIFSKCLCFVICIVYIQRNVVCELAYNLYTHVLLCIYIDMNVIYILGIVYL